MPSKTFTKVVRYVVPRPVRNWLRSPSKSAGWLLDSAKFSLGFTRTFQLWPDHSLVCHPRAYSVACDAQIQDPEQGEEFRNFIAHCCGAMFLFDLGAHFGIFSLAAASFGGRAVAVDPSPVAVRMIGTQAKLNHFSSQIQILRAAVSDAIGEIDSLSSGVFSDGYFRIVSGRAKRDLTRTTATTVDEMVRQFGKPTHIKIDVEGHEAAVLRGARDSLKELSPLLFIELHNELISADGGDPSSALDELDQLGYETFALSGSNITREEMLSKPLIRIVAKRVAPKRGS